MLSQGCHITRHKGPFEGTINSFNITIVKCLNCNREIAVLPKHPTIQQISFAERAKMLYYRKITTQAPGITKSELWSNTELELNKTFTITARFEMIWEDRKVSDFHVFRINQDWLPR